MARGHEEKEMKRHTASRSESREKNDLQSAIKASTASTTTRVSRAIIRQDQRPAAEFGFGYQFVTPRPT